MTNSTQPEKPRYKTIYCTEADRPDMVRRILRFRKNILVDRFGWDLKVVDDIERDEFDTPDAVHGAILDGQEIIGCFRLTRTDRPYLAFTKFGHLAQKRPYPRSPLIWEISRLAVAESSRPFETMLFSYSAIFNFAISRGATSLVAFADVAKERLVKLIGITTDLMCDPTEIGKDAFGRPIICVAGELPLRLQKGPKFERLLSYTAKTEIEDADTIFGCTRISA